METDTYQKINSLTSVNFYLEAFVIEIILTKCLPFFTIKNTFQHIVLKKISQNGQKIFCDFKYILNLYRMLCSLGTYPHHLQTSFAIDVPCIVAHQILMSIS